MAYSLDDLQSDIGHLANLLEVIADHFLEDVSFVDADGNRLGSVERLNALIWIARDLSNGLTGKVEQNYEALQTKRAVEGDAA